MKKKRYLIWVIGVCVLVLAIEIIVMFNFGIQRKETSIEKSEISETVQQLKNLYFEEKKDIDGDGIVDEIESYNKEEKSYVRVSFDGAEAVFESEMDEAVIYYEKFEAVDLDGDGKKECLILGDLGGNGGLGAHKIWFLKKKGGDLIELPLPYYNENMSNEEECRIQGYGIFAEMKEPYVMQIECANGISLKINTREYIEKCNQEEPGFQKRYESEIGDVEEESILNVRGFGGYVIEPREAGNIVWFVQELQGLTSQMSSTGFVWTGLRWDPDGNYKCVGVRHTWEIGDFPIQSEPSQVSFPGAIWEIYEDRTPVVFDDVILEKVLRGCLVEWYKDEKWFGCPVTYEDVKDITYFSYAIMWDAAVGTIKSREGEYYSCDISVFREEVHDSSCRYNWDYVDTYDELKIHSVEVLKYFDQLEELELPEPDKLNLEPLKKIKNLKNVKDPLLDIEVEL